MVAIDTQTENAWTKMLQDEEPSFGFFCFVASEKIVEIAGYAGIDFVIFDTEHASYDVDFIERGARAAKASGMVTVVRVPGGDPDPNLIARILDTGVDGLMFARVADKDAAERLVDMCLIEPRGSRGSCPGSRAGHYALLPLDEYRRRSNDVSIMVMIETKKAFDEVEEIMNVPGITGITVGRDDLASALGAAGGRNDPEVVEAERRILKLARSMNIGVRGSARNMDEFARYASEENCPSVFSFLTDSYQIGARFQELVEGANSHLAQRS